MSREDREFEVYKKFANWVLILATDKFMIQKKQLSTERTAPPKDNEFRKPSEFTWNFVNNKLVTK